MMSRKEAKAYMEKLLEKTLLNKLHTDKLSNVDERLLTFLLSDFRYYLEYKMLPTIIPKIVHKEIDSINQDLFTYDRTSLESMIMSTITAKFAKETNFSISHNDDLTLPEDKRRDIESEFLYWTMNTEVSKIEEEIDLYVILWLAKWRARVQICFTKNQFASAFLDNTPKNIIGDDENIDRGVFFLPVVAALLNHNEICCVDMLARYVIDKVIKEIPTYKLEMNKHLDILARCFNFVKEIAAMNKKLIFVKVGKLNE